VADICRYKSRDPIAGQQGRAAVALATSSGGWIIFDAAPAASAVDPVAPRSAPGRVAQRTLAKEPGRDNVEVVSADLVAMPETMQPADVLWLHLFYPDLHTALIQARGATAARFNRAVYERLRHRFAYRFVKP